MTNIKSTSIKFSLKVWLTAGILSPVTAAFIDFIFGFDSISQDKNEMLGFIGLAALLGLVYSIPSLIMFTILTISFLRSQLSNVKRKIALCVFSMFLTFVSMFLVFGKRIAMEQKIETIFIELFLCYTFIGFACIAFFNLKTIHKVK